jgi:hypothetical protein
MPYRHMSKPLERFGSSVQPNKGFLLLDFFSSTLLSTPRPAAQLPGDMRWDPATSNDVADVPDLAPLADNSLGGRAAFSHPVSLPIPSSNFPP